MKKVLFICMGNICRSAAAEAVLKQFAEDRGVANEFFIDSAGIIGYHAGERADKRMIESAFERGYRVTSISRQVTLEDFEEFDYIIAMDNSNVEGLKAVAQKAEGVNLYNKYVSKISKLTEYCTADFLNKNGNIKEVPDPYYGGTAGFKLVLDMLENASGNLIRL